MKLILVAVLGFATILGGGTYVAKSFSSTTNNETVTVVSPKPVPAPVATPSPTNGLQSVKSVLKPSLNKNRVLYLNSQVDESSVNPLIDAIKALNEKSSEPIWLLISSPGGSVLHGALLISEMEASKAPVNTVCTLLCASMAAMIHGHGANRYALDRAILMYHPASAGVSGQVKNMKNTLTTIDRYIEKMVTRVVSRSKIPADQFQKEVAYELWIDAEDAVERGLNDAIVNLSVTSNPQSAITFEPAPTPEEQKSSTNPRRTKFDIQMMLEVSN